MRRSLSGLVLGLALLVGSLSWASFVLTQTVLNPDRSEAFADQVIDNDSVRGALIGRIAEQLGDVLPVGTPVPRQELDAAASGALDDPTIASALKDAIVQVHQNALNGVEEDVKLDASALGIAARERLVGDRLDLDEAVPAAPALEVELPTAGLAFLGTVRSGVETFSLFSAAGAALAALLALIVAKNRPAVLRRVAFWAFGTAAFWLVLGYGVPFAAQLLAPASAALIAAAIDVFFGAMIQPALFMAGAGVALLLISAIWPSAARRRPGKAIHARPIDAPQAPVLTTQSAPAGSNVRSHGAEFSEAEGPAPLPRRERARPEQARPAQPAQAQPAQAQPAPDPLADRTRVMPVAPSADTPFANPSYEPPVLKPPSGTDQTTMNVAAPAATATVNPDIVRRDQSHPEWKPGVGYLDSNADQEAPTS